MKNMTTFNHEQLKELKALYMEAIKNKQETFFLNGNEYVTGYAKYLIEYLETKLK